MQEFKLTGSAPVSAATVKVLLGHNYHNVLSYGLGEEMISHLEDLEGTSITETTVSDC